MPSLMKEVLPAVIASNQEELDQMLDSIKSFAENIMLDLMDSKFVSTSSLDFDMTLQSGPKYQLHVMAIDPIKRLLGAAKEIDTVVLHYESLGSISEAIIAAKEKGVKLFIALNPETGIEAIEPYLSNLDGILIMAVNPGKYGAKFLPEQLDKVKKIRSFNSEITIAVDGGMNEKTARSAVDAGANQIASGSYIMKSEDPEIAYRTLKALFNN